MLQVDGARQTGGLFASRRAVDLEHGRSDSFVLVFVGDAMPPQPRFEAPSSLRIKASPWTPVLPSSPKREQRWEMCIRLETDTAATLGDALAIRLGSHLAVVDLTGRPWKAAWAELRARQDAKKFDESDGDR